jgi:predicted NUDIX family NTP pyrophosphohydrolase
LLWQVSLHGKFFGITAIAVQTRGLVKTYFIGAMAKQSAGLLVYRVREGALEVFLVHPGGPFWAKKDAGAWSIPKGEFASDEEPLAAAKREFTEETGIEVAGPFAKLGTIRQSGGKLIHAFVAEADFDATAIVSNTFTMEWPPRSGRFAEFPEVDRAGWVPLETAAEKINTAQRELLTRLRAAFDGARG